MPNTSSPTGTATRRPRWRRRLRIAAIVTLSAVGLVLASAAANLALESAERSSITPYGEKVQVSGGALNVYREGSDGSTIVLLSGLGTAAPALDFAPLIRALGGYKIVVVEGFGYGYSDTNAPARTLENITAELHEALSKLDIDEPYVLMGHSLAGFYTLHYANQYPDEVSAVVGIDPTVPATRVEQAAPAGETDASGWRAPWERAPSATGLVRWATSISPALAEPAGDAYTAAERERIRLMSIWNFANPAVTAETIEMGNNARRLDGLTYPDDLPVLTFLAQESIDSIPRWYEKHERQLRNVKRQELVVLDGGHYLHWTHSPAMAEKITEFLGEGR